MGSGMNTEQAKEYAKTMTYSQAVSNIKYGKGIKYRKATMIKLRELAEIADRLDRKTEPQRTCDNCGTPRDKCVYCIEEDRMWTPKTEPTISKMEQVETMSCAECKHRPIGAEICEEPCHYEPQTDWHYDEQDATWYPYKHEDEPQQKSCATCKHALGNWDGESNNCGRCCGADHRFYEPKDEPQTERSE